MKREKQQFTAWACFVVFGYSLGRVLCPHHTLAEWDWDVLFWGLATLLTAVLAVWHDERYRKSGEQRELYQESKLDAVQAELSDLRTLHYLLEARVTRLEEGEEEGAEEAG